MRLVTEPPDTYASELHVVLSQRWPHTFLSLEHVNDNISFNIPRIKLYEG